MRIIGGTARGRPLVAPSGRDTRPTQDRVREALFNILQSRVEGARVLDCFAGSGAVGLEALSRGAAWAVLVDAAVAARNIIRRNVGRLGFEDRVRILDTDWRGAARTLAGEGARFDIIYLDPPYRMEGVDGAMGALGGLLAAEGLLILEHARKTQPPDAAGITRTDARHYGDTALSFFQCTE